MNFCLPPGSDTLARGRAHPGGGYAAVRAFSAPAARRSAGEDEQGPYWCAEGTVPADVLRSAFGCVPQAGGFWPGNVFLYDTAAPGFGAAFPLLIKQSKYITAGFRACAAVRKVKNKVWEAVVPC